jgi:hypothetical protein
MSRASSSLERVAADALTLVVGLVVVGGLLQISVFALGTPWLGAVFGAVELLVAWRVSPPEGARVLRWVTGMFGAFTLGFSVLWMLAS